MSTDVVGSFTLLEANLALAAAIPVFLPLLAQFDLNISLLGSLEFDLNLQFNAALDVALSLNINVSNPLAAFEATLQGLLQLQASISLAIQLGLPTISVELDIGVSAQLALAAALGLQLGGIGLNIEASLALKLAALNFIAQLQASLSAGPVFLLSIDDALAAAGAGINGLFSAGLTDPHNTNVINPGDSVHGLVLVTKDPGASIALGALFKLS